MKFKSLLIAVLAISTLYSCKKDDKKSTDSSNENSECTSMECYAKKWAELECYIRGSEIDKEKWEKAKPYFLKVTIPYFFKIYIPKKLKWVFF